MIVTWKGCYGSGWDHEDVVDQAWSHPAKFSKLLIFRLIDHLVRSGYVCQGTTICDPFGGVALGALPAMAHGLRWIGCELEPRFCAIANGYDCRGQIVVGEHARTVAEVPAREDWYVVRPDTHEMWGPDGRLGSAFLVTHDPLFPTAQAASDAIVTRGQLWALELNVSDLPVLFRVVPRRLPAIPAHTVIEWRTTPASCGRTELHTPHHVLGNLELWRRRYGFTGATLLQGDSRYLSQVLTGDCIVSSPPYGEVAIRRDREHEPNWDKEKTYQQGKTKGEHSAHGYGTTPGNLGSLPVGDCVVSSPPYADQPITAFDKANASGGIGNAFRRTGKSPRGRKALIAESYGSSSGQLGAMKPGALADAVVDAVVGSPPFSQSLPSGETAEDMKQRWGDSQLGGSWGQEYGESPGQLGAMKPGTLADAVVGSPPFQDCHANGIGVEATARQVTSERIQKTFGYGHPPGQLGMMKPGELADTVVGSPPFCDNLESKDAAFNAKARPGRTIQEAAYGQTPWQLGAMPTGDCIISSPPYAGSVHDGNGIDQTQFSTVRKGNRVRPGKHTQAVAEGYGQTPGNLGNLPTGGIAACVSSPPFGPSQQVDNREKPASAMSSTWRKRQGTITPGTTQGNLAGLPGGKAKEAHDQLGNTTGPTFWSAASEIMAQVRAVLKPGGVCVWVVKDYVSKGKIVPFCQQWLRLCKAHGFVLLEEIHASLIDSHGIQTDLFGEDTVEETARMSFFRRLHVKKYPHLAIRHETVLILRKEEEK